MGPLWDITWQKGALLSSGSHLVFSCQNSLHQEEHDQDILVTTWYRQFCGMRNNFNLNIFVHGSTCECYLQDMLDYLNNDLDDCRSEVGWQLKALSFCSRLLNVEVCFVFIAHWKKEHTFLWGKWKSLVLCRKCKPCF
jgi:hypothetical protein